VLILTDDQSVNTVSAARDQVQPLYRISLPEPEMVHRLADKTAFQALAEKEGFAVPRAVAVCHPDAVKLLSNLRPPLILKPADKTLVLKGAVERTVRADTIAEAQTILTRMLTVAPRIIVQEWIDGPDDAIFFTLFSCDREGRPLGVFSGQKLCCSPPAVGSTALCVPSPEVDALLVPPTLEFIARVGYRGLGSLEFKRDSRNGRFLIIEPTVGRTDWQEEIATLCGVNLPLLTYRAELDAPPMTGLLTRRRVAWRSSMEFRAPKSLIGSGTRVIDGLFRRSDPIPAVYYYGYERCLQRVWRRARRILSARTH
jgi:predicted ATP-grasp superfamily ATP-dependent carboligase